MKTAIYGQSFQPESESAIFNLLEALKRHKSEVWVERSFASQWPQSLREYSPVQLYTSHEQLNADFDFLFSLGGDGTMLRTALYVRDSGIPVVGINTGRLGFLATVQKDMVAHTVDLLAQGAYGLTRRSLVQVSTETDITRQTEVNYALNEITVSRKNTTSMITIATWLNGEYLTSYWADGLIVATPTGSTGYSLSCNGPVIDPSTNAFVLTPIAPHNLNARPLVIPDNTKIKLQVSGREEEFLLSLDSRIATLSNETELLIERAPFTVNMVELDQESFLKTLRKKLLWGEDRRN